jgi:hypothetical protein
MNAKVVPPRRFSATQARLASSRSTGAPNRSGTIVNIGSWKILQAIEVEQYWQDNLDGLHLTHQEVAEMRQEIRADLVKLRRWLKQGRGFDFGSLEAEWALLNWAAVLSRCSFEADVYRPCVDCAAPEQQTRAMN